jgi:cobalamin biosynthesis Co2+ chelatase CbiK
VQLIQSGQFESVFLVTNKFGKDTFKSEKVNLIEVDSSKDYKELIKDIKAALSDKIIDTEVAVNMISGTGKEHMAMLAALLQLGLGLRFVVATEKGVEEI